MFIDSHCHFNSLQKNKIDTIIESCLDGYCFIDSSIDLKSSKISVEISSQHSFIYTSLGFHPFSVNEFSSETIIKYQEIIEENKKIVAIGEIGLDYKANAIVEDQEKVFIDFVKLAQKNNLPIVIHNRFEGDKILDILNNLYSGYDRVIFHCFSYSPDLLDKILERGAYVSFSLNVLRKNKAIIASLKKCPLDRILLETDSPYMRIKNVPSTPLDIRNVYSFAAEVKDIKKTELEEAVFLNAKKVFNLREYLKCSQ